MQIKKMYNPVLSLQETSHLRIIGKKGNVEIVKLEPSDVNSSEKNSFTYRFIKFKYDHILEKFKPVLFNVV